MPTSLLLVFIFIFWYVIIGIRRVYPSGLKKQTNSCNLKESGFTHYPKSNADNEASRKRTLYSDKWKSTEWEGNKLAKENVEHQKEKKEDKVESDDESSPSVVASIERYNKRVGKELVPSMVSVTPRTTPSRTTPRSARDSVPVRRLPAVPTVKSKQSSPVSTLHSKRVAPVSTLKTQSLKVTTPPIQLENKTGVGRGARRKGAGSPSARAKVVNVASGVGRTKNESLRRGGASPVGDMVKGFLRTDYDRLHHFLEFVDSVTSMKPDEDIKFFESIMLDKQIQQNWRMIAHYLMVGDEDINEIEQTSFFAEDKCMRVFQTWRRNDVSADYLEVIYALINTLGYNPAREAKSHIPLSSFDSTTHQSTRLLVSVPLQVELLTELEKELTREKEKGVCGAEVILQGDSKSKLSKPIVFRLVSLDRDGLRMVDYACKAAAADHVKQVTLKINYLNAT